MNIKGITGLLDFWFVALADSDIFSPADHVEFMSWVPRMMAYPVITEDDMPLGLSLNFCFDSFSSVTV